MTYLKYVKRVIEVGEPNIPWYHRIIHHRKFLNDCSDLEKACYMRNGYNRKREYNNAVEILTNILKNEAMKSYQIPA